MWRFLKILRNGHKCTTKFLKHNSCKIKQTNLSVLLWIAFKNLYLWHRKQLEPKEWGGVLCCELLSKICIFDIGNNEQLNAIKKELVVNCFQKFVSLTSETTTNSHFGSWRMLWIAFKNLYLWHRKQQFYLWIKTFLVVNCFQKFVSLTSETTSRKFTRVSPGLWIAFKNLYLWHRKQPNTGFG